MNYRAVIAQWPDGHWEWRLDGEVEGNWEPVDLNGFSGSARTHLGAWYKARRAMRAFLRDERVVVTGYIDLDKE